MEPRHLLNLALLPLALALLAPAAARAQADDDDDDTPTKTIYQYTDDQGALFFVDDLELVPPQYRDERHLRKVAEQPVVDEAERPSVYESLQPRIDPSEVDGEDPLDAPAAAPAPPPVPSAERMIELTTRRDELLAQLTLLEEGYAEPDAEPLTPGELERLSNQTEEALRRVDELIGRLRAGEPPTAAPLPEVPGPSTVKMEVLDEVEAGETGDEAGD